MKTFEDMSLETIRRQAQGNCDISDAAYCGAFSLCSFLLLIRNYYKWFHGLEPWEEGDSADTLEWIEERENLWEQLEGADYSRIEVDGASLDPFDLDSINGRIGNNRLIYSAGYSYGLKPTFFMADVEEKTAMEGMEIYFLGEEYARDMPAAPALRQQNRIYVRRESARFYLYDRISERYMSKKATMLWAMKQHGVESYKDLKTKLDAIADIEIRNMAYHEIGEALEDAFNEVWSEMISRFSATSVERFLRSLKDVLADTHPKGMVRRIIEERNAPSLGIYAAFLDGFQKLLFPQILGAVDKFMVEENWRLVEDACEEGYEKARAAARRLIQAFHETREQRLDEARSAIESVLINPLYCANK